MAMFSAGAGTCTYTIGDLAELYDVSRRTLRFYEERELLRPRRHGTQRLYSEDDRLRLEIIIRAKRLGFSLAVIWELMDRHGKTDGAEALPTCCEGLALSADEISAQVEHLTSERERVDRAIEELRQAAARHGFMGSESSAPQTSSGLIGDL